MKAIAKEVGTVDATRDTMFTDWAAVDRFAREFVGQAERAVKSVQESAPA